MRKRKGMGEDPFRDRAQERKKPLCDARPRERRESEMQYGSRVLSETSFVHYTDNNKHWKLSRPGRFVFNGIFTLEAIIKILSQGFTRYIVQVRRELNSSCQLLLWLVIVCIMLMIICTRSLPGWTKFMISVHSMWLQGKNQFDFAVVCLCDFGLIMWLVLNRLYL